ncbi:MAG TPA: hypothetical protein VEK38_04375, partial [Candidatus Bathyarchaeia archaeon]|nr:hypothetical protein [Candidatus Bathyarchaeia archaeon]
MKKIKSKEYYDVVTYQAHLRKKEMEAYEIYKKELHIPARIWNRLITRGNVLTKYCNTTQFRVHCKPGIKIINNLSYYHKKFVNNIVSSYGINPENIMIKHDNVDLPFTARAECGKILYIKQQKFPYVSGIEIAVPASITITTNYLNTINLWDVNKCAEFSHIIRHELVHLQEGHVLKNWLINNFVRGYCRHNKSVLKGSMNVAQKAIIRRQEINADLFPALKNLQAGVQTLFAVQLFAEQFPYSNEKYMNDDIHPQFSYLIPKLKKICN